jgi:hypothetical protein
VALLSRPRLGNMDYPRLEQGFGVSGKLCYPRLKLPAGFFRRALKPVLLNQGMNGKFRNCYKPSKGEFCNIKGKVDSYPD